MLSYNNFSKRLLFISGIIILMMSLAACNFRPLHGKNSYGSTTHAELSKIFIAEPVNRISQLVRNNLLSDLAAKSTPNSASYELKFDTTESKTNALVQTSSESTLVNYTLRVKYHLIDMNTRKVINSGESFSVISYDRVDSEFANVRAELNVQKRAAKAVSIDLRTRIGAFFATK